MNFSKLKLNNYLVENAPGVEITSNNPAARNSKTSGNMVNATGTLDQLKADI